MTTVIVSFDFMRSPEIMIVSVVFRAFCTRIAHVLSNKTFIPQYYTSKLKNQLMIQ